MSQNEVELKNRTLPLYYYGAPGQNSVHSSKLILESHKMAECLTKSFIHTNSDVICSAFIYKSVSYEFLLTCRNDNQNNCDVQDEIPTKEIYVNKCSIEFIIRSYVHEDIMI